MIETFDRVFIHLMKRWAPYTSRAALAIVFVWFGALKLYGMSPAYELVQELLARTLPHIHPESFMEWFGLLEVVIGVLFVMPRWGRVAILLLGLHMLTTVAPLVLLSNITWVAPFVPSMEGQYIIKNIAIVALGMGIIGTFHPLHTKRRRI